MIEDPNGGPLQALLTTTEAAEHAGVASGTIRSWAARGYLAAAGRDGQGRPLYRLLDIAKAERATRERDSAPTRNWTQGGQRP